MIEENLSVEGLVLGKKIIDWQKPVAGEWGVQLVDAQVVSACYGKENR